MLLVPVERRARPKAWALDLWGSGNRPDKLKQRSGGVSVREIIRSKVSANKGRRSECESERRAGVGSRKYRKVCQKSRENEKNVTFRCLVGKEIRSMPKFPGKWKCRFNISLITSNGIDGIHRLVWRANPTDGREKPVLAITVVRVISSTLAISSGTRISL